MDTILMKPLSPKQEDLINQLVTYQGEFDQPSEEDLKRISSSGLYHFDESLAKLMQFTEMEMFTVRLTVEVAKRLPGFESLLRKDQITLLRACSREVMMLRFFAFFFFGVILG